MRSRVCCRRHAAALREERDRLRGLVRSQSAEIRRERGAIRDELRRLETLAAQNEAFAERIRDRLLTRDKFLDIAWAARVNPQLTPEELWVKMKEGLE